MTAKLETNTEYSAMTICVRFMFEVFLNDEYEFVCKRLSYIYIALGMSFMRHTIKQISKIPMLPSLAFHLYFFQG